jgi:hypothetical protein
MDYKELQETKRDIRCHDEAIDRHDNLIHSIKEKMVDQENNTNSQVEVIMGILLQQKRHITALETEQRELHHLVAQLSKGKHSRNYIHVHLQIQTLESP